MFAEERRRRIIKLLEMNGSMGVKEIARELGVSPSTVRNDLRHLESQGLIYRTHGGAMSKQRFDPLYQKRTSLFPELKRAIAKKAVEFVREGDVIFVDSGSITLMFVEELAIQRIECIVVTNSLYVLNTLSDVQYIPVYVMGGEFKKRTMNFIDPEPDIGRFMIMKAFMGISGFDDRGCYVSELFEAQFKRKIMDHAREVYVLADKTKYGKTSAILIREWKGDEILITNEKLDLKNVGEVVVAGKL